MKLHNDHPNHYLYQGLLRCKKSTQVLPLQNPQTSNLIQINMDKFASTFQNFGKTVSSSVTPFAARSQQWIKEQTGNAGEKTELPHDYIELETRIEALKQTHQKLLAATSQYANEAYDYPPNIRESVVDLGKSISEKVRSISQPICKHSRHMIDKLLATLRSTFLVKLPQLAKPKLPSPPRHPPNLSLRPSPMLSHALPSPGRNSSPWPRPKALPNRTRFRKHWRGLLSQRRK